MLSDNKDTWGFKSTWHIFQATVFFPQIQNSWSDLRLHRIYALFAASALKECFKALGKFVLSSPPFRFRNPFFFCFVFLFFFWTDFRPPLKTTLSAKINGYYADLWKKEPNIAWSVFIDEGWLMLTAVSLSAQLRRNDWSWPVVYPLTIDRSWKQPEARNCQTSAFFELFLFWRCCWTSTTVSVNNLEQNNIW